MTDEEKIELLRKMLAQARFHVGRSADAFYQTGQECDTERGRKYNKFRYKQTNEFFAEISEVLKKTKPEEK